MSARKTLAMLFNVLTTVVFACAVCFTVVVVATTLVSGRSEASLLGWKPYIVLSDSMQSEFEVGDIAVSRAVDPAALQPGDIVTFQDPEIPGRILIKRCIAVGGQTVDINDEDGLVYVDGVALAEPYTDGRPTYTLPSAVTYPYTVPDGMMWMMGDNRTNSQDSRFFGAIPVSSVTGRGALVYWPLNDFSLLD